MNFYRKKPGDYLFFIINGAFMIFLAVITTYPFLYVLFASLSEPSKFITHNGALLYPLEFTLKSYKAVLNNPNILIGYKNTLFIVVVGTVINVVMTSMGAYFLSRRGPLWKTPIMIMITITMFVEGGLIPGYLLIRNLGLYDSLWALILPSSISTFNMIVMRTAFQGIPASMEESAKIDGANDFTILYKIVIPLSRATIAVIALFYAVFHWNSWFSANIYLKSKSKFPLQLVLRNIVISSKTEQLTVGSAVGDSFAMEYTVKYAAIMVATIPILIIYPFIQKYFVKGVMMGSLKE